MLRKKLPALLCALLCLSLTACAGAPEPSADSVDESLSTEETAPASSSVDFRLTSGHHTAGVDFPAGTYKLLAIQWCGNVESSNGSVSAAMGTTDWNTDGRNSYIQEQEDVELPTGTVLSLTGGVILRMISDNADTTPLQPRNQEITEDVYLSAGRYTAGVDFPAGTYDFTATNGVGNVESSNMFDGGISDIMGTTWRIAEDFGFCDQYYQNVELPEGTVLNVAGVDLLLSPSK